ncbi:MAG: response regulator transcription factor [Candidatus Dormibacteria bacterium]
MIRLLLADDHAMVREALATLLRLEGDFEVVAGVADGLGVLAAARATRPDLALIDIEMPGSDGLTVAETLARELPEVKVVIVTAFGRPGFLRRALEAGVSGYLLKDRPAAELAVAALSEGANPLSPRELEVLAAAHGGAPLSELAATLHLSVGTVKNHLSVAIGKLGARNRAEAIRIAEERGWLPSWSRPENRSS